MPQTTLVSVNLAQARPLMAGGRAVLSAIGKRSVSDTIVVKRLGLEGDEQADLSVHGGLDKALYAYASEHYAFWQEQRRERGVSLFDEVLPSGFMGENLTLQGLDFSEVWIGDELHLPDAVLCVTAPREPCFKFNAVMGYSGAARDMARSGFCGFYLSVRQAGSLQAGQLARLVPGRRAMRVAEVFASRMSKHLR